LPRRAGVYAADRSGYLDGPLDPSQNPMFGSMCMRSDGTLWIAIDETQLGRFATHPRPAAEIMRADECRGDFVSST
jgi:hypothetical protein